MLIKSMRELIIFLIVSDQFKTRCRLVSIYALMISFHGTIIIIITIMIMMIIIIIIIIITIMIMMMMIIILIIIIFIIFIITYGVLGHDSAHVRLYWAGDRLY